MSSVRVAVVGAGNCATAHVSRRASRPPMWVCGMASTCCTCQRGKNLSQPTRWRRAADGSRSLGSP
jgi:hypothetical protein